MKAFYKFLLILTLASCYACSNKSNEYLELNQLIDSSDSLNLIIASIDLNYIDSIYQLTKDNNDRISRNLTFDLNSQDTIRIISRYGDLFKTIRNFKKDISYFKNTSSKTSLRLRKLRNDYENKLINDSVLWSHLEKEQLSFYDFAEHFKLEYRFYKKKTEGIDVLNTEIKDIIRDIRKKNQKKH